MDDELVLLEEFLGRLDSAVLFALEHRTQLFTPAMVPHFGDLLPLYRNRMALLRTAVRNASPQERAQLAANGLTGAELAIKLAGFNTAYGGFQATRTTDARDEATNQPRWRRWLKKVFGWGNVLLGSIPFGAKDAVEEIKGTIERGIEDGEDHEYSDGNVIFKRKK